MKVRNRTLKMAFVAFLVVAGVGVQPASAMHKEVRVGFSELKIKASEWRHQLDHFANTDVEEILHAKEVGNFDQFARHYAEAAGRALEHYIDTNLLAGGPNTVMLDATCGNLANAGADVNVYALVTNVGGAAAAGAAYNAAGRWGTSHGPTGQYAANEMPADLTKGAFITALQHRMRQVSVAHLIRLHAFHAIPLHLSSHALRSTSISIRNAVKDAVGEWLTLLATGGGGADMFDATVSNAGGPGLVAADITGANAGAPGISLTALARNAPRPATLHPADIAAAFDDVIDMVDLF